MVMSNGSRSFIEDVKAGLCFRGRGRDVKNYDEGYPLRENAAAYNAPFQGKNNDIGTENILFFDVKIE